MGTLLSAAAVHVAVTVLVAWAWIRLGGGRLFAVLAGGAAGWWAIPGLAASGASPFFEYARSLDYSYSFHELGVLFLRFAPILPALGLAVFLRGPRDLEADARREPLGAAYVDLLRTWWGPWRLGAPYVFALILLVLTIGWHTVLPRKPTWWEAAWAPQVGAIGWLALPLLAALGAAAGLALKIRRQVQGIRDRARLFAAAIDVSVAKAARLKKAWLIAVLYLLPPLLSPIDNLAVTWEHVDVCAECGVRQVSRSHYGTRTTEPRPGPCTEWYRRRIGAAHECRWCPQNCGLIRNPFGRVIVRQYFGRQSANLGDRDHLARLERLEPLDLDRPFHRFLSHRAREVAWAADEAARNLPKSASDAEVRWWWERTRARLEELERSLKP